MFAYTLRRLLLVWLALLVLLALTVGLGQFELGALNPILNLSIAIAKALLIAAVFMHLRDDAGTVRLFAAVGLVWLTILFGLTFADYLTRP